MKKSTIQLAFLLIFAIFLCGLVGCGNEPKDKEISSIDGTDSLSLESDSTVFLETDSGKEDGMQEDDMQEVPLSKVGVGAIKGESTFGDKEKVYVEDEPIVLLDTHEAKVTLLSLFYRPEEGLYVRVEVTNHTDTDRQFGLMEVQVNGVLFDQQGMDLSVPVGETMKSALLLLGNEDIKAAQFHQLDNVILDGYLYHPATKNSLFITRTLVSTPDGEDQRSVGSLEGKPLTFGSDFALTIGLHSIVKDKNGLMYYSFFENKSQKRIAVNVDYTLHLDQDVHSAKSYFLNPGEQAMINNKISSDTPDFEHLAIENYKGVTATIEIIDYDTGALLYEVRDLAIDKEDVSGLRF